MKKHKYSVTVAIPTFNRAILLSEAITSAVEQSHQADEIIVVDNNSTDHTREVVNSFNNIRIRYVKNKQNIGMIGNWNKSIRIAKGNYIVILGDDDLLRPDFIKESVDVHKKHGNLGFTFTHCNKVDQTGKFLMRWGYDFPPTGYLQGMDYLYWTAKYGCCLTNSSTVLINKRAYEQVSPFEQVFGANTFDFNMWIKLAAQYDVYFIDKVLVDYRLHKNQVSEIHWRTPNSPTGKIGSYLEILGIFEHLLANSNYADSNKKTLILHRITEISKELAGQIAQIRPEL